MTAAVKRGLSVLVVEDDEVVLNVVRSILSRMGATHIQLARNGKEALAYFYANSNRYDLIVSDWEMPEMDGLALLGKIRAKVPNFPFMMLTARSAADAVIAARKAAVSAYIVKPFTAHDLQSRVAALIEQILASSRPGNPESIADTFEF